MMNKRGSKRPTWALKAAGAWSIKSACNRPAAAVSSGVQGPNAGHVMAPQKRLGGGVNAFHARFQRSPSVIVIGQKRLAIAHRYQKPSDRRIIATPPIPEIANHRQRRRDIQLGHGANGINQTPGAGRLHPRRPMPKGRDGVELTIAQLPRHQRRGAK